MMICLLFLSEAYTVIIGKQEMERVLRLPEISGRGQNWVEGSRQQFHWSEEKVKAGYMQ